MAHNSRKDSQCVSGTRTVSPPSLRDKPRRRRTLKKPYYSDVKREKDRLQRLYSDEYVMGSTTPARLSHTRQSTSRPELHHSDRYRRLSPLSMRRLQHRYRGQSRSRSRSRERRLPAQPRTQIITIPVAVLPDYPYAIASWLPQYESSFPLNHRMSSSSMTQPVDMHHFYQTIFLPYQSYAKK